MQAAIEIIQQKIKSAHALREGIRQAAASYEDYARGHREMEAKTTTEIEELEAAILRLGGKIEDLSAVASSDSETRL